MWIFFLLDNSLYFIAKKIYKILVMSMYTYSYMHENIGRCSVLYSITYTLISVKLNIKMNTSFVFCKFDVNVKWIVISGYAAITQNHRKHIIEYNIIPKCVECGALKSAHFNLICCLILHVKASHKLNDTCIHVA